MVCHGAAFHLRLNLEVWACEVLAALDLEGFHCDVELHAASPCPDGQIVSHKLQWGTEKVFLLCGFFCDVPDEMISQMTVGKHHTDGVEG